MNAYPYEIRQPTLLQHSKVDSIQIRRQYRQNILENRRHRGSSTSTTTSGGSTATGQHLVSPSTAVTPSSSMSLDSSFPYELPMEWRPSQFSEYQPYPSPYPSPAPTYVPRPSHTTGNHSSVSNATAPTASPTLSSTSSPHHGPSHAHSHSHTSHNAPIDPTLQEPYAHSWSHPQSQQSPIGNHSQILNPANSYATPPPSAKPASAMSRQELEQELSRLKTRVNELEVVHHWFELKGMRGAAAAAAAVGAGGESDVHHHGHPRASIGHAGGPGAGHHHHHHQHNSSIHSVPSIPPAALTPPSSNSSEHQLPIIGGVAPTEEFAASWRARTDARIKRFCALNRAGNALCAWHDSRRERRAYPPRQAPPGYLNCGCTEEEALFEESLARHGVGSYHPGEMVRMDPALRNPLLKLLERRFGYVDGDFERDPASGLWVDGEGSELWETILPSGKPPVSGGRKRGETK